MDNLEYRKNKLLLRCEVFMGVLAVILFFAAIFFTTVFTVNVWIQLFIIILGIVQFIIFGLLAIKVEQITGYYKCKKCEYKYIPTYSAVFFAMHMGRTRYLKCPKCKKRSWNKKII